MSIFTGFGNHSKRYELSMVGTGERRQYLIARESDLWLEETERVQAKLDDLGPDAEETADVLADKTWLEYILVRRDDLAEELLRLQGVLTEDDVIDLERPSE